MFNCAQLFYVSKASLNNSAEADVTAINLFFKKKPLATNNRSGILNPGTTIYIVPTVGTKSVPDITNINVRPFVRVEWADVKVSDDASLPTTYRFSRPLAIQTNANYALVIKFDGDEEFELHKSTSGELAFGSDLKISTISTDPNISNYFSYISPPTSLTSNTSSNNSMINSGTATGIEQTANATYLEQFWSSSSMTVLTMEIFVARYSVSGDFDLGTYANTIYNGGSVANVINGNIVINIPQHRYEYVAFDDPTSKANTIGKNELCFQWGPLYPNNKNPAAISINQGSNTILAVSNTLNWSSLFNLNDSTPEYIVVGGWQQDSNTEGYVIRRVTNVISNSVLQVSQDFPFTNTSTTFMRAPVAVYDQMFTARIDGLKTRVAVLKDSTANSSARFVNNSILSIAVTNGGTGYSNNDYVTFTGYENVAGKVLGGYSAIANLTTNATGGITSVYMANAGAGFVNASAIVTSISNSSAQPSTGSGATFSPTIGSVIRSEQYGANNGVGGYFSNCQLINLEVGDLLPQLGVNNPVGTAFGTKQRLPYYVVSDAATSLGKTYYCDADDAWDSYNIKSGVTRRSYLNSKSRVLPSWSMELVTPYANGTISGGLGGSTNGSSMGLYSNASVLTFLTSSNNDFTATKVVGYDSKVTFTHYILNNDYSYENTNYGNAWAKGIEVKFSLANNSYAEDLLVYATAYRPPGANIVAFARLYNTNDSDAFDDKEWTMLQLRSGANTYSSPVDLGDTYQMTWGLQPAPNSAFTLAGSVSTTLSSATVAGSGTTFQANLAVGDMVKIYSPLFPTNYMIATINSITSNTSLTLNKPVSNNGIVGTMTLDKIAYPHQVYNNGLNSNVAQYYNLSGVEFNTFNVIQLKFVLLSGNTVIVPMIDDIQALAVSA